MKINIRFRYLPYIFFSVLLVITAYLLLFHKKEADSNIFKTIIADNYRLQPLKFSLLREINIQEISLKNKMNEEFSLGEVSKIHNLIFFLNGNSCWSCVELELNNVKDLYGKVALVGFNIQESYLFQDESFKIFEEIFISNDLQKIDAANRLQVPVIMNITNDNIRNMYIAPKHKHEFPFFKQIVN